MITTDNTTNIQLLGTTYQIKCPAEKIYELQEAAQAFDKKLREVSNESNLKNPEQIALMAGLNMSHELIIARKQTDDYIKVMHQAIEELSNT